MKLQETFKIAIGALEARIAARRLDQNELLRRGRTASAANMQELIDKDLEAIRDLKNASHWMRESLGASGILRHPVRMKPI